MKAHSGNTFSPSAPFWLKRSATYACYGSRSFHEFTFVHHTNYLALTQFVATRRAVLSRFLPRRKKTASLHCQGCSLFKPLGSPNSTGGSLCIKQLLTIASCRTQKTRAERCKTWCENHDHKPRAKVISRCNHSAVVALGHENRIKIISRKIEITGKSFAKENIGANL